jgi:hypothetical protein
MLLFETLPASLAGVLVSFQSCFTAPTFRTFVALLSGMIARPARRTVCGMLIGAGLSRLWHHGRAHWFFAQARWQVREVGLVLAGLVVASFVPAGAPIVVVVDDSLFRRSGRKVRGAAWQHDGSRQGSKSAQVSWGTCFVVAAIVVNLAFMDRPVCLPVLASLWKPKGTPKTVLAGQMMAALLARFPDRVLHMVADSHYAGADGARLCDGRRERGLPPGVWLTSRLGAKTVFNSIATPQEPSRRGGRPRTIGPRLGSPTDLAATATWTRHNVTRYASTDTVDIAEIRCLWYGVYRSRPVRVILVRDPHSKAKAGYDLALITTDPNTPAADIVALYASRWSIEVAFEDAKTITGVGEARNRTHTAVERTVPFGLITQSIITLWYAQHGHHPDIAEQRRHEAPWYRTKTQPAYLDMIIKLRRVLIAARFRQGTPRTPTPQETLEVHQAWAEAAA